MHFLILLLCVKPFFWSWLIMLVALAMLVVGLGVRSFRWYATTLVVYSVSLVVQLVGFVMSVFGVTLNSATASVPWMTRRPQRRRVAR